MVSSSSSSSSSSDLLRSSSFSSSVFSVFFKSLVNSLMILCSLQLHSSQDAKKAFVFLFFLSLLGVFPFAFKSFLFNSHQIKPSPISSSLIVYLFTFGLCFVFSLSTNSNPFLYFFSCVFFFGSWSLLADQMGVYTWTKKQTYSWSPRLHIPRLSKFSILLWVIQSGIP
jgi:hypothetical protein